MQPPVPRCCFVLVSYSWTIALAHPKERQKKWKLVVFLLCGCYRQSRCIYKGRTHHSCCRPPLFLQAVFLQSQDSISYKYLLSGGAQEACQFWSKRKCSCHSYDRKRIGDNLPLPTWKKSPPSFTTAARVRRRIKAKENPVLFLLVKCCTHSGWKGSRLCY